MKNENMFEKADREMKGIEDVQTFTEELTIRATERIDDFMFEVMQPYCEKVSKQFITKKDLENALTRYFNKGEWKHTFEGNKERVTCNRCGHKRTRLDGDILYFCPNCGADMRTV